MIEERLNSLGVKLSDTQHTIGSFVPVVITGNLVFVSGQIPIEPGSNSINANYKGKVGRDISLEDGQAAARLCIINGLSELKQALGSLDKIKKFVKVSGYVNCDASFTGHAKVINGASDFIVDVFGEKGKHARVSVGASSLAFDSSVEVELIVEV
ncbi:MAG TPA: RidA family protein [Nitrososphaeraceae archaeon]|nr:RidA family protein [Nitrososphaeraceae archaeon]